MSMVRSVRTRKKSRVLGKVQVVRRETYAAMDLDTTVALIRSLVPLGLMHVPLLLDEEVEALAGARDARQDGSLGVRHGSNPGTGRLAGQRVPIRVPRVRGSRGEWPLRSYATLHGSRGEVDEGLLRRVLYGVSCRNYEAAAEAIPGAIGLSSSTVSARLRDCERSETEGVPGAGSAAGGPGGGVPGWEHIRDVDPGSRHGSAGHGREAVPGVRGDEHGERGGADTVPAVAAGAWAGHLEGPAGDCGRRQGAAGGGAEGVHVAGPGAALPVAPARARRGLPAEAGTGDLAPAAAARL